MTVLFFYAGQWLPMATYSLKVGHRRMRRKDRVTTTPGAGFRLWGKKTETDKMIFR